MAGTGDNRPNGWVIIVGAPLLAAIVGLLCHIACSWKEKDDQRHRGMAAAASGEQERPPEARELAVEMRAGPLLCAYRSGDERWREAAACPGRVLVGPGGRGDRQGAAAVHALLPPRVRWRVAAQPRHLPGVPRRPCCCCSLPGGHVGRVTPMSGEGSNERNRLPTIFTLSAEGIASRISFPGKL
jgi:hypothetical protein